MKWGKKKKEWKGLCTKSLRQGRCKLTRPLPGVIKETLIKKDFVRRTCCVNGLFSKKAQLWEFDDAKRNFTCRRTMNRLEKEKEKQIKLAS